MRNQKESFSKKFEVTEKINGLHLVLFHYKGKWIVGSKRIPCGKENVKNNNSNNFFFIKFFFFLFTYFLF